MPAGYAFDKEQWANASAEERETWKQALAQIAVERQQNPIAFYRPHPKQVLFHEGSQSTKLFLGGNRSGKTHSGIADDLIQALDADCLPDHLRQFKRWEPPFFCRIVIPDMTRALEGVTLQKFRELCPKDQLEGGGFQKAYEKNLGILRLKNGSWFQFLSNEMDLDKFSGAALHRVHFDEEPREDIYKECLMRLIDYGGDALFTMTPLLGLSWTYATFWEPHEKAVENDELVDDTLIVTVDMDDNPYLNEKTKSRVLAGLSNDEREARKRGRFVSFGGLIYANQWSKETCVVPDPDPDEVKGWTTVVGIDPGWAGVAAVVYLGVDSTGRCVVFDEIALHNATASAVIKEIFLRNAHWGILPTWYVIDPSARNKNHETGRSVQMEYQDNGIFPIPGQNSVDAGINRVKERMEAGKFFVAASCEELQREFPKYRWQTPKRTMEGALKKKPVKRDDHLLDALRYALMSRPYEPDEEVEPDSRPFPVRMAEKAFTKQRDKQAGEFGPGIYA